LVGCIVEQNDELVFWKSRFLVLATGGAASMYSHTSNPLKTRADVIGIALRRGFLIENPEFVQFHPTVFENTNLLISEAVRGEGAILVNQNNERFVNELEPRDVVARAIYREMLKGNKVYLDMRNLKVDIKTRFPTIYNFLIEHGLDPYKDLVPITPAAHYYIGGIRTDENGETTVDGVYATGEVASTRVHGANRLASNSLLEGVVFGYRAAYSIALSKRSFKLLKAKNQRSTAKDTDCQQYFETIKNTMWQYAGLERTEEGLLYAIKKIREIIKFCIEAKPTKKNKIIFDVSLSAYATLQGALKRRESRGCHFRSDFPYEKDEYRYNTKICLEDSLENLLD
jgi:L-aspartate oxidase (EC 1.4.3.16)